MRRSVLMMISSMRGGGSERQTLLMLRHLDRNRFAPQLYVTQRAGELLQHVPADVPIHSFDDVKHSGALYVPGRVLRRQVAHLRELVADKSIDVIYDRTFHMTMIAGKVSGVPRVSTIVSPPERALPLVESRFVTLKRHRLAKAYRQSRSVVAVSNQVAISARRYYRLDDDHVQVVHNPVDLDAIRKSAAEKNVDRDSSLTLACVGRMSLEKGHTDLIQALAMMQSRGSSDQPSITLWMIGDGPLREDLQQLASQSIKKYQVKFFGASHDTASLIAAADALVLPSHFEGLPNVVLEAMAVGTPVIATRAGGTVELERDEPTILWAEAGSPSSLAEAITRFAGDREGALQRAVAATRLVEEHHDVRHAIGRIETLLW